MSGNLSRAGEASFAGNGLGRIRLLLAKSDNDDRPVEIFRQSVKRSRAYPLGIGLRSNYCGRALNSIHTRTRIDCRDETDRTRH